MSRTFFRAPTFAWALLLVAQSCALPELTIDPSVDDQDDENDGGGGRAGGTGGNGGSGASGGDQGGTGGTTTGGQGGSVTGGTAPGGAGGSCTGGLTNCSGDCVDTASDADHCGTCDMFCEPSEACMNGVCVCQNLAGPASYLLIDDLEDGDNIVGNDRDPALRVGYWYAYHDETMGCTQYPSTSPNATFTPNCGNLTCEMLLPTPNGSRGAAHMAGNGCVTWGAGMGFDFNSCDSMPTGYDASAYSGIRFWYRSTTTFRVTVGMIAGIPTDAGGTCIETATDCYNHHGANLPASTAGTTVTLPFSMLSQDYGTLRVFDASQLANIQFQVDLNEQPFDLWIDDISFTP